jgi:cation transport ATPase
MKINPENPEHWSKLVERAQRDTPPAIDLDAVLRAVHSAQPKAAPTSSWVVDFAALFCTPRIISACLLLAFTCSAFTTWSCWSFWDDVGPWAEVVNETLGDLT